MILVVEWLITSIAIYYNSQMHQLGSSWSVCIHIVVSGQDFTILFLVCLINFLLQFYDRNIAQGMYY